jgi:hypothetical protein
MEFTKLISGLLAVMAVCIDLGCSSSSERKTISSFPSGSTASTNAVAPSLDESKPKKVDVSMEWKKALGAIPPDFLANPSFAQAPPVKFSSLVQRITSPKSMSGEERPYEAVQEVKFIAQKGGLVLVHVTRLTKEDVRDIQQSLYSSNPSGFRIIREERDDVHVLNGLLPVLAYTVLDDSFNTQDVKIDEYDSHMDLPSSVLTWSTSLSTLRGNIYPFSSGTLASFQMKTIEKEERRDLSLNILNGKLEENYHLSPTEKHVDHTVNVLTVGRREVKAMVTLMFADTELVAAKLLSKQFIDEEVQNEEGKKKERERRASLHPSDQIYEETLQNLKKYRGDTSWTQYQGCDVIFATTLNWVVAENCNVIKANPAKQYDRKELLFDWNHDSKQATVTTLVGYTMNGQSFGQSFLEVSQPFLGYYNEWRTQRVAKFRQMQRQGASIQRDVEAEIAEHELDRESHRQAMFSTMLDAMATSMNIAVQGVQQYQAARQGIPPTVNIVPGQGMGEAGAAGDPYGGAAAGGEAFGAGAGLGAPGSAGVGGGTGSGSANGGVCSNQWREAIARQARAECDPISVRAEAQEKQLKREKKVNCEIKGSVNTTSIGTQITCEKRYSSQILQLRNQSRLDENACRDRVGAPLAQCHTPGTH